MHHYRMYYIYVHIVISTFYDRGLFVYEENVLKYPVLKIDGFPKILKNA